MNNKKPYAIGQKLHPNWNNEACSICKDNYSIGYVKKICEFLYNDKCIVEQFNNAINQAKRFNYLNSMALETIRNAFPQFTYSALCGTEKVFIKEFNHWFHFYKNYTGQIYICD